MPPQPLLNIHHQDLPAHCRKLLYPRTLENNRPPTAWIPATAPTLLPRFLKTLAAWGVALIFTYGLIPSANHVPPTTPLAAIYLTVALVFFCLGALSARRTWRSRQIRKRVAVDRHGLHLSTEGLLLWDGNSASWIPKDAKFSVRESAEAPAPSQPVLDLRSAEGSLTILPLPAVPFQGPGDHPDSLINRLKRWRQTGHLEAPASWTLSKRQWAGGRLHNALGGHILLLAMAGAALGLAGLLSISVPVSFIGLAGVLIGVPAFLTSPWWMQKCLGPYLLTDEGLSDDRRPLAWGYLMLLGLGALFLLAIGMETSAMLFWQLRAVESAPENTAEIIQQSGRPIFHRPPPSVQPASEPLGHSIYRTYLGDGVWLESAYFVLPLVDRPQDVDGLEGTADCLWLGASFPIETSPAEAKAHLMHRSAPAWAEAVDLEISGLTRAVEAAQKSLPQHLEVCAKPMIMIASVPRDKAILGFLSRWLRLQVAVHGVAFTILVLWLLWHLDRRPPPTVVYPTIPC